MDDVHEWECIVPKRRGFMNASIRSLAQFDARVMLGLVVTVVMGCLTSQADGVLAS